MNNNTCDVSQANSADITPGILSMHHATHLLSDLLHTLIYVPLLVRPVRSLIKSWVCLSPWALSAFICLTSDLLILTYFRVIDLVLSYLVHCQSTRCQHWGLSSANCINGNMKRYFRLFKYVSYTGVPQRQQKPEKPGKCKWSWKSNGTWKIAQKS